MSPNHAAGPLSMRPWGFCRLARLATVGHMHTSWRWPSSNFAATDCNCLIFFLFAKLRGKLLSRQVAFFFSVLKSDSLKLLETEPQFCFQPGYYLYVFVTSVDIVAWCCMSFAMSGLLRGWGALEVSGTRWCRACFGQCMECSCSSDRRIVSRPACANRPCKPLQIQKLIEHARQFCETFCPWPCRYSANDSSLIDKAGVQSLPHHHSWLAPQLHCNLCPPDQAAWMQELLHCLSKVPTDVTRFVDSSRWLTKLCECGDKLAWLTRQN